MTEKKIINSSSTISSLLENLTVAVNKYSSADFPKVSIVIPTIDCAPLISLTLESVLSQDYTSFEVIIIDCSKDRTLEIVKSYHDEKMRIFSVSHPQRYEMLNRGISQATGTYINFLFPGDFYLFHGTLKTMMALALDHNQPELVYCGTLLRDPQEVKIMYRHLTIDLLKKGQQPTSLQSCWFKTDVVRELGKFDSDCKIRGGFDLLCRFCLKRKYRVASINRVLIDYDLRAVTRKMILIHFLETRKLLSKHFGYFTALRWVLIQKDFNRFLKLWLNSLKIAFLGRK